NGRFSSRKRSASGSPPFPGFRRHDAAWEQRFRLRPAGLVYALRAWYLGRWQTFHPGDRWIHGSTQAYERGGEQTRQSPIRRRPGASTVHRCNNLTLPFGPQFVSDIVNRTHTALDQTQCLLAAELVIKAQAMAKHAHLDWKSKA